MLPLCLHYVRGRYETTTPDYTLTQSLEKKQLLEQLKVYGRTIENADPIFTEDVCHPTIPTCIHGLNKITGYSHSSKLCIQQW